MSLAEELLNTMSEGVPVHTHPVPDTDTYFIIDPITRKIENTTRKKTVIMQYDHNSERFTFELPRYVDGHDMLECTSITINVDNIEAEGVEFNSDAPDLTDIRVHPNDPEKVITSWLISRNSTQLAGRLSFHIEFKCVDSDGNVVYEWATDTFEDITIKARKKNGETAVIDHSDLLEQWRAKIFGAGDSVIANIASEGEAQIAAVKAESETQQEAVELKGAQSLDSIPEDYTKVDAMADEAVRTKGDAIVCEAAGEVIRLNDSSNDYIRGLKLFGKTTQVTTTGAQALPQPYYDSNKTSNGVKFTVNADGSITISGTSTATELASCYFTMNTGLNLSGTYTYKCYGLPTSCVTNIYYIGDVTGDEARTMTLAAGNSYGFVIRVKPNANVNATVYPMLVAGDTIKPYEPYTGDKPAPSPDYPQELFSVEQPTAVIYGRNLVDINRLELASNKSVTVSKDGYTITLVGGSDKTYAYSHYDLPVEVVYALRGRKLRLTSDFVSKSVENAYSPVQLNVKCADNTFHYPVNHSTKLYHEFTVPDNAIEIRFGIYTNNSASLLETDNTVVAKGIRLTLADDNEYEPFRTIEALKITHSIHGIPVTSGGNYTDSNGQQWIRDEINLERGVYVQRIGVHSVTGNENWIVSRQQPADNGYTRFDGTTQQGKPPLSNDTLCTHAPWTGNTNPRQGPAAWVNDPGNTSLQVRIMTMHTTVEEFVEFAAAEYAAGSPITYRYALKTPIETPLTAEEITAFKSIRTNYPNTTILNDAGAWMSAKYNADTKAYIDAPKVLKLTDSSTGVVYELKIVNGTIVANPV